MSHISPKLSALKDLKEFSLAELEAELIPLGKEKYRAQQIFRRLYQRSTLDIDEMTELSKVFRQELKQRYFVSSLQIAERQTAEDGTSKLLFQLADGNYIESVLIPEDERLTLCISSQVGCRMGCRFCLTGKGGFIRNLTAAEIINQILQAQKAAGEERRVSNLVFMGMGEPFMNFSNCMKSLDVILNDFGLGFSSRRVTVSTCGIIPGIKKLFQHHPVQLAISLNASSDETRSLLMPINKKYPLAKLQDVLRSLPLPPRRRIVFEYVMIKGVNDTLEDARRLARLLHGIPSKINLIPYNEIAESEFRPPSQEQVDSFRNILLEKDFTVITRKSKGRDISAACGQLRGRLQSRS